MFGVDCSEHQGRIDWDTVRPNIAWAIARASGYGWERADYQFYRNRDELRRLGIPRGFYYFAGLGDPIQQADRFADIVGPLLPGESVWLDWEADVMSQGEEWALTFIRRAHERFGVLPGIYMSASPARSDAWGMVRAAGVPLWVAAYNDSNPFWPDSDDGHWPYAIWQYSSDGHVPGISGGVDVNRSYVNFPSLGLGGNLSASERSVVDMYETKLDLSPVVHPAGYEQWRGLIYFDPAVEVAWLFAGNAQYGDEAHLEGAFYLIDGSGRVLSSQPFLLKDRQNKAIWKIPADVGPGWCAVDYFKQGRGDVPVKRGVTR